MGGNHNNFWASGGGNRRFYVWRNVEIKKQNSLFGEDTDAAILDAYINVYKDTYSKDITDDFTLGLTYSYLDNIIVIDY